MDVCSLHAGHGRVRIYVAGHAIHGPAAIQPVGAPWSVGFLSSFRFSAGDGKLSYCMYLIHLAILHLAHGIVLHSSPRIYDLPGAAVSLFAFLLTYGFAKISWVVFEHPLILRGHKFIYRYSDNLAEPQTVDLKS